MRQPTLFELLRLPPPRSAATGPGQLELYSYFAGAGGFCTGAAQAGCRVVWACDACPLALETHRRNHPHTEHQCLRLPSREAVARLPTDGRRFHVHASPPCVKVSSINRVNVTKGNEGARGHAESIATIAWCLDAMLGSECTSWSMEQVASPEVVAELERARQRHPGRVAWMRLDLSLLGVPQVRTRLIAGSPRLVARLRSLACATRRRSVRSVIPRVRGTHVRHGRSANRGRLRLSRAPGETKFHVLPMTWGDGCLPVDGPAHTVTGQHALNWVSIRNGKAVDHCVMHPRELAALQTFPDDYKLPVRKSDACLQIGNAVPPLVARLLLEHECAHS